MGNKVLNVYDKSQYQKLKADREKRGHTFISMALIEIYAKDLEDLLFSQNIDIDITTVIQLRPKNTYVFEKLLYLIEECNGGNINYFVEKEYGEKALEELGIFFSSLELVAGYTEVEKNTGKNREKKVRTVINIRKDRFVRLAPYLNNNLVGHLAFKEEFKKKIDTFRFFNKQLGDHPIFSIFLLGNSGVGKTEVGRTLQSFLSPDTPLAKVNFANYKQEHSLASLIGSPPGYVNSDTESELVKKINQSNAGVLLVDEFEKAGQSAHNFFLQLLEEGRFDDAMGNVYDLNGYIIVFTSNLNKTDYSKILPAELRSRFDLVSNFKPLKIEEKRTFAASLLDKYLTKSKIIVSKEDKQEIIKFANIEKEDNLRNVKRSIRLALYEKFDKNE